MSVLFLFIPQWYEYVNSFAHSLASALDFGAFVQSFYDPGFQQLEGMRFGVESDCGSMAG